MNGGVVLPPGSHPLRIDSRHHSVALVYKLARGGPVVFKLRQVAPACGVVRTFTVRGHAGRNRMRLTLRRFAGSLGGGIYRIRARSHGRTVVRRTLVVGTAVAGQSSCGSNAEPSSAGNSGTTIGSSSGVSGDSGKLAASAIKQPLARRPAGVLGARAAKLLPGSGETQVALLIVLVAAIALLAVGAIPRQAVPSAAAGAFVARQRPLFALAGLAALAAFLVSYFLT